MIGKKISELNELIKGKRNITVQRDILLSAVFGDPEQKRLKLQNDFDYIVVRASMQPKIQELFSQKLAPTAKKEPPVLQKSIPVVTKLVPVQPSKTKAHEVFDDF